jgi:hypothetical protein
VLPGLSNGMHSSAKVGKVVTAVRNRAVKQRVNIFPSQEITTLA